MALRSRKDNWALLSGLEPADTVDHRDVYEDQQLGRTSLGGKQTKTSRTVIAAVVTVLLLALAWLVLSVIQGAQLSFTKTGGAGQVASQYWVQTSRTAPGGSPVVCYRAVNEKGAVTDWSAPCYDNLEQVPVPEWYKATHPGGAVSSTRPSANPSAGASASSPAAAPAPSKVNRISLPLGSAPWWKIALTLLFGLGIGATIYSFLMKNLDAQNLLHTTEDINQYQNDQHIALPQEVLRKFDLFPDAGAHANVQVSSLISHVAVSRKGLKTVVMPKRATADVLDATGAVEYYAGEVLYDEHGEVVTETVPIVDEEFAQALFDASSLPKDPQIRTMLDPKRTPYNPDDGIRGKLTGCSTVADLINNDWELPEYETQRPGGAYVVDTEPVNTMVLAITRAGKGQTVIEPTLDMWTREKEPNNIVVNDPKGELITKFYVPATLRGFQVVQFNLINAMKTDIYNPLGMAADAAREGDSMKCALYVENIADVFFPVEGAEDPVWPNAANNAFKRAAYGLIDYYLEEERELRETAARTHMDPKVLETRLDEMWGKVTLYNCYQLFVQLTSKRMKNPLVELQARAKSGEFDVEGGQEEYDELLDKASAKAFLWEDKPEADLLTLYFNATAALPRNSMRTLVANADNALRAMGGADKMLASVYGIAITAMSFFTDPTISTLTSGTPSQNTDLGGMSFPRRMGVRFGMPFLKRDHLIGMQARWDAFNDAMFTQGLGEDFTHEDIVSREGWARYYFKGIFPNQEAWVRLRLVNPQTGMLIRTFHFHFRKDFQTSLNGRYYVTDPITDKKIIKNGLLTELTPVYDNAGAIVRYRRGATTYPHSQLTNVSSGEPKRVDGRVNAVTTTMVRYSEAPKMVFLVTPPHMMKYAKLVLILMKQLVDLNFDKSYMTKSNQKPLLKTRWMLDELGNLQTEGHGIGGFETMLSIGLGQDQQFTLILQTLQQLRDVYGDSVDKIVQGNVSNIIFLKSTDDSMLETLAKMSGTRHTSRIDGKTITRDMERLAMQTEGKVSYNMTTSEEPVISYNDLAFLGERQSIVFRASDPPVWNRRGMILPMSWRLRQNTLRHPGHNYSLQTIPTLSSALDFDVRANQPDFNKLLAKRMSQAERSEQAQQIYRRAYGYDEYGVSRLDPDVVSDEVMDLITRIVWEELGLSPDEVADVVDPDEFDDPNGMFITDDMFMPNPEVTEAVQTMMAAEAVRDRKQYADQTISPSMLVGPDGRVNHQLDKEVVESFKAAKRYIEKDLVNFRMVDGSLCSANGTQVYIQHVDESDALAVANQAAEQAGSRVYSDEDVAQTDLSVFGTYRVEDEFYRFLAGLKNWLDLGQGHFDREMARRMNG